MSAYYLVGCENVHKSLSMNKGVGFWGSLKTNSKQHVADFKTGFLKNRAYFLIGALESASLTIRNTVGLALQILLLPVTWASNAVSLCVPSPEHGGLWYVTDEKESLSDRISNLMAPSKWGITIVATLALGSLTNTLNGVVGVFVPVAAYGIDRCLLSPMQNSMGLKNYSTFQRSYTNS